MSVVDAISLFLIMIVLALIPSASVALVVTRSATFGVSSGIAASLGIVLGDLVFILLAIMGLSVVAETIAWLFLVIKYIGAAYIIWFGIVLLTTRNDTTVSVSSINEKAGLVTSLFAGLCLTLGDIKAIFFYVSLFPTFLNLKTLRTIDILVVMLITIVAVGGVKLFYALSASKVVSISKDFQFGKGARKVAGSFMVGMGSYLAIKA